MAFVQRLTKLTPQPTPRPHKAHFWRLAWRQHPGQLSGSVCHTIPGVSISSPNVGPPLTGLASRSLIAGKLVDTPDNLMPWLRHPKVVKPLTAMPDLGVKEHHARDIAACLATLH